MCQIKLKALLFGLAISLVTDHITPNQWLLSKDAT